MAYKLCIKLKEYLKKFVLKILSLGIRGNLNTIKRITWLGFGRGYGDVFVMLAVPREIKKTFSNSILTFAANKKYTSFMRYEKNIDIFQDTNFIYDFNSIRTIKFYADLIKLVRQCKTELLFICPDWLPFFALPLLRLAGVKHVVIAGDEKLSNAFVSFYGDYDPYIPIRELIKKALELIGCKNPDLHKKFYITEENKLKAAKILSDRFKGKCNKEFLFFNPEGSEKHRCFSFQHILEILKALHINFPKHSIVVSNYKKNFPDLPEEFCEYSYVIHINDISLLISVMEQASVIVSVDTSTVHIADVLDKPLVAIYSAKYLSNGKKIDPPETRWRSPRSSTVNLYSDDINDISPKIIADSMAESFSKANAARN